MVPFRVECRPDFQLVITAPPMQSSEIRPVASLAVLYITRMLGLFMVLPVLTLAGSDYSGSSLFLLGVALGIYGLTQALFQIPFGLLSDRFGRKPLIGIGLILFALGSVVAATAVSVEGLILGRALQGAGAIAGVIMAMVADFTTEQNRTKAMAAIGASIGVAFALSLVLGPAVVSLGSVRWIFWLTLGSSMIGLLILAFIVPGVTSHGIAVPATTTRNARKQAGQQPPILDNLKAVITNPSLLRLNIGIYSLHAVLMALFVALPLLLESIGIARQQHSWVYLIVMAGAFLLMVPLIIIGERRQQVKTVFLSVLLMAMTALVSLAFVHSEITAVFAAMLAFFTGFNYLEANLPSLMSKIVPADKRGAGSGVFSSCQFLGAATGGIMGGWLFEHYGLTILMLACATIMFGWWLLALPMKTPKHREVTTENVIA